MKFCPFCGKEVEPDSVYCLNCGKKLPTAGKISRGEPPTRQSDNLSSSQPRATPLRSSRPAQPRGTPFRSSRPVQPAQTVTTYAPESRVYSKKNPGIAALLSLIIPGLGQIYLNDLGRGLRFLFGTIILIPILIGFVVWIVTIFDAYSRTNDYNLHLTTHGYPPW